MQLKDQQINEAQDVELSVTLTLPDVKVKWQKDGEDLELNERISQVVDGTSYTIRLENCVLTDSGEYSVVLPNGHSSTAKLRVKGQ